MTEQTRVFATINDGRQLAGDELLVAALDSSDERKRILGRAIASGYPDAMISWLQAESERGTDPATLLEVVLRLQVDEVVSFVAQVFQPGADQAVAASHADFIRNTMADKIGRARKSIEQRNAEAGVAS